MKAEIKYVIHKYREDILHGNGWWVIYKSGHKRYYGEYKLPKIIENWILEPDTFCHDVANAAIRYDKNCGKLKRGN